MTTLVADVADAARAEGVSVAFMDFSGAIKGYATGRPSGEAAASIAWQLGIDLPAIAAACGSVEAIGYAYEPDRLRFDLEAYRAAAPDGAVSVVLRPVPPDSDSAQNLREKVQLARELGLARVGFYHYGLMPLDALDRIRAALSA